MELHFTNRFKKQFKKIPNSVQISFEERIDLFLTDPTNQVLRVHPLKGKYAGYWSLNITGDIRALYRKDGDEIIIFALIGTHSSLYG